MKTKSKKLNKKAKIIAICGLSLVAVVAVVVGIKIIVSKTTKKSENTYRVRIEKYENVIEIAGTVSAAKEQKLQAKNDGTVVGVYKKAGDVVKKGDLILQEDDSEQQYNLAKLEYEIDTASVTGAKRDIELKKAQRTSLLQKIEDRKIVATFDGVIADLDVDEGDYLEAKDSIGTLVDVSSLIAEVEIAETDVAKLKLDQKVIFKFPAYDGEVFGRVVYFPAIGKVTSRGATIVNAKIQIDDVPEGILPNYSFSGQIEITAPETKLVVERYAIGHEKGKTFVETIEKNGATRQVDVKVQPYGQEFVEILDGLEGGEILKELSPSSISGRFSQKGQKSSNNKNNNNGMQPMGGPPPMR